MEDSQQVELDRWDLETTPLVQTERIPDDKEAVAKLPIPVMNNYFRSSFSSISSAIVQDHISLSGRH